MKVIIACSSLQDYVDAAQSRAGTNHPVIYLNQLYHRDPDEMSRTIRLHVLKSEAIQYRLKDIRRSTSDILFGGVKSRVLWILL